RLAHEGEDERLRDTHQRELDAGVARLVDVAVDAGDADAEEVGRRDRERRIDVRGRAFAVAAEAFVRLVDELLHTRVRRQRARRDVVGAGVVHQKRQNTGTRPTATPP